MRLQTKWREEKNQKEHHSCHHSGTVWDALQAGKTAREAGGPKRQRKKKATLRMVFTCDGEAGGQRTGETRDAASRPSCRLNHV